MARGGDRSEIPGRGHHRRDNRAGVSWTLVVPTSGSRRHAGSQRAPIVSADTPESVRPLPTAGLATFQLGNVPASVTPPRTWRRAAIFAVGAAVFVVLALVVATVMLMGPPRTRLPDELSLPSFPSNRVVLTRLPDQWPPIPSPGRTRSSDAATSSARPSRTSDRAPAVTSRPTEPGSSTTVPPTQSPSATRTTVNDLGPVNGTSPQVMGDVTEQYFAEVTSDSVSAHQLTTGEMRAEGPEGIDQRYGSADQVRVRQITIDPSRSVATADVEITSRDGNSRLERRRLTFSRGSQPLISRDASG
jgi:hypothetical protein